VGEVQPLPKLGGVFTDARRAGRTLRVSWHAEAGVVVVSLWDGARCTGTVQVPAGDVPELIRSLTLGLESTPRPRQPGGVDAAAGQSPAASPEAAG
jgi:hypothetical protein